MVKWFCEDVVINFKNEDGEMLFIFVIKSKNMGIIDLVFEWVKVDLLNNYDESLMMLVIVYGYEFVFIKKLVDLGVNFNCLLNGVMLFLWVVDKENVVSVVMFIWVGVDFSLLNEDGEIVLY